MANVIHTVKVVYGSYSGTVKVMCDENDDNDDVKARVKRQEGLNFLSMCSESYKIINTEYRNDSEEYDS